MARLIRIFIVVGVLLILLAVPAVAEVTGEAAVTSEVCLVRVEAINLNVDIDGHLWCSDPYLSGATTVWLHYSRDGVTPANAARFVVEVDITAGCSGRACDFTIPAAAGNWLNDDNAWGVRINTGTFERLLMVARVDVDAGLAAFDLEDLPAIFAEVSVASGEEEDSGSALVNLSTVGFGLILFLGSAHLVGSWGK